MIPRRVPRYSTETALRLIRMTNTDSQLANSSAFRYGRIQRTSSAFGGSDITEARRQSYYLRIVSITEAYTDVLISEMLNERVVSREEIVGKLMLAVDGMSTNNWPRREQLLSHLYGINLSNFPRNSDFAVVKRVRNIIAHGLGKVSQKEASGAARLMAVGVEVRDNWIIVSKKSLNIAADVAIAYIGWLDTKS